MTILDSQLAGLRTFGYTEVEARFLCLVATHSGYFTVRQFLDFAQAKSGKRNARLVAKLFALGHVNAQRFRRRSLVYHLHSRVLYEAIGKPELRHRRNHQLAHVKARLLALDYILANPENDYFETARAKRAYFIEDFGVAERLFLPSRDHGSGITFADGFPLCIAHPSPDFSPVVTFTYLDSGRSGVEAFVAHLRTYRPLFQQLPSFRFHYVSASEVAQPEAAMLFELYVQGNALQDLTRYFDLKTKWDNKQYGLLTDPDVLFLSESRKRFTGDHVATLYYLWKRKQLPKHTPSDPPETPQQGPKAVFRVIQVPGHEGIFGSRPRKWSDGWQIGGGSSVASLQRSPVRPTEAFQNTANG